MHPRRLLVKQIGQCLCNILLGFGVRLLCVDVFGPIPDLVQRGAKFVDTEEVKDCAGISCCPLTIYHHQLPRVLF